MLSTNSLDTVVTALQTGLTQTQEAQKRHAEDQARIEALEKEVAEAKTALTASQVEPTHLKAALATANNELDQLRLHVLKLSKYVTRVIKLEEELKDFRTQGPSTISSVAQSAPSSPVAAIRRLVEESSGTPTTPDLSPPPATATASATDTETATRIGSLFDQAYAVALAMHQPARKVPRPRASSMDSAWP